MNFYDISAVKDAAEFVAVVNKARLASKGTWYQVRGELHGKNIGIKGYGTWLQIFRINGTHHGACAEVSVKDFKAGLAATYRDAIA